MNKKIEKVIDYYLVFCVYALIGWLYEVFWMRFVVAPHRWINRGVLIGPFLPIYGFGMLLLVVTLKKMMQKKHSINDPIIRIISIITCTTFLYTTIIEYTTPKIYHVSDFLKTYGIGLIISNIIAILFITVIAKQKNKKSKPIDLTIILVFLMIWIIATSIEYISHFVMDKYFHIMLWDYTKDFLNVNKRINWDASRNFAIGGTFLLYTVQPLLNKIIPKINNNKKLWITLIIGIPMLLDFIFHVILKMI